MLPFPDHKENINVQTVKHDDACHLQLFLVMIYVIKLAV